MFGFLNKPYPFNNDLKYNAKIVVLISLIVLAYLLFFLPVDPTVFSNKEIFFLIFGLTASIFIILSVNLIFLPSFLPKQFDNSRWNIKKEIIWNTWTLLTITLNYYIFYSKLFGIIIIDVFDFGRIIFLGLITVAGVIVFNHNRLLSINLRNAKLMNRKLMESKLLSEKLINFDSDYKKDNLIVKADSIILIKSADNYLEVYYKQKDAVVRQMVRNSLRNIEDLLSDLDFIKKVHRSFIVNIHYIKEIQGNSQGYKLFFQDIDFPALVSPKYLEDFKRMI